MKILIIGGTSELASAVRIALASGDHEVLTLDEGARVDLSAESNEPKWIPIFPVGVTKHRHDFPGGKIEFTRGFFEKMLANWASAGRPAKPINYFHRGATEYGDVTPIEQKVAAGWMSDFKIDRHEGREWFMALTSWTPKARGHILADELRYLSPEFSVDAQNKATGKGQGPTLFGAALLNDPYLEELPRVAASNSPHAAAEAEKATTMDRNLLIKILGLAATATDDDIIKALEAQKVKLGELDAEVKKLNTQVTEKIELANGATKLAAEMKDLREENVKLTSRVTAMEAEKKAAEVDTYLSQLVKDGKLAPAMREAQRKFALSDFATFKEAWDKAPVSIPLTERGITGAQTQLSATEARVKLTQLASDIATKNGISMSQARDLAVTQNPELARTANGVTA